MDKIRGLSKWDQYIIWGIIITIWALICYTYTGREDGSSGLSILGWIHMIFMLPGLMVFMLFKKAYSNADIPFIAFISWLIYLGLTFIIIKIISLIRSKQVIF